MKAGFLSLVLAAAGAVIPVAAQAVAQSYQLDIPRQPLDAALKDLAKQTGLQIARFSDTPGGSAFVGPLKGNMPVADALKSLLTPNELTYKLVNDHTIAVMTLSAASAPEQSPSTSPDNTNPQEGKKSVGDSFRLAQASQGVVQNSSTVGSDVQSTSGSSGSSPGLEAILVTAQKKNERLQDVPVPVTVIAASNLADNDLLRLQDYYSSVPGLTISPGLNGTLNLSIRGISTAALGTNVNPTVGITVDDVPYGGSWLYGGAPYVPDGAAHLP